MRVTLPFSIMDPRLSKAARLGDLVELSSLLDEDPLILEKVALSPISETPLHIAALAGKADFARKIINLKPSFARELNKDGFSPLHIASATGNLDIVRELLKLGPKLCLAKDKGGRTPLHLAAVKGRLEVIQELLHQCPEAAKEVTAWGETALHLAVKNNQFEVLKTLVEKLDEENLGELLNAKDKEGDTIFQIAVATKQAQALEFLQTSQSKMDVEMGGSMDPYGIPQAVAETSIGTAKSTDKKQSQQGDQRKEAEDTEDAQEMVLVVASLIATVTYQAGLAPPSTIWRQGMKVDSKCIFHGSNFRAFFPKADNNCPGLDFYLFLSFNTAGFFASVFLIFLYRRRSYVQVLLVTALVSMMATYLTLSVAMSPEALSLFIIYFLTLIIFFHSLLAVEVFRTFLQKFSSAACKAGGKAKAMVRRKKKSDQANVCRDDAA